MDGTNTPNTETEIAQLKRTIAVLLNYNEALQQELAALKAKNALWYSPKGISENGNDLRGAPFTTSDNDNALRATTLATSQNDNGNWANPNATSENNNALRVSTIATSENESGNRDSPKAIAKNESGNSAPPKVLPPVLEMSPGNIGLVYRVFLKPQWRGLKRSGRRSASILLIHFYNKGGGTHPELVKLTELSRSGLGKFVGTLKRRGLIQRTAYQTFRPTTLGLQVLAEALGQ